MNLRGKSGSLKSLIAVAAVASLIAACGDEGQVTSADDDNVNDNSAAQVDEDTDDNQDALDDGTVDDDQEPTDDGGADTDTDRGAATESEDPDGESDSADAPAERDGMARNDPDDPRAIGDIDAPVTLLVYGDFQCPHCMNWSRTVKPELLPLIEDGTLRLEYHDFILFGEESEDIAAATHAAGEQGLFWEFYEAIVEDTAEGSGADPRTDFVALAEEVGVADIEQFQADLDSTAIRAAIDQDHQIGQEAGVPGTPALFLNEELIENVADPAALVDLIETEASNAG